MEIKIKDNPGLQHSIFCVMGLAFDYNLQQLATLFLVKPTVFEKYLKYLGFSSEHIRDLKENKPYADGFCSTCGVVTTNKFCSEECANQYLLRRKQLLDITLSYRVPFHSVKNTYYDILSGKIEKRK
jgi:hypothetical protein